nr:transposase [Paenibacillus sp. VKM B-2647]
MAGLHTFGSRLNFNPHVHSRPLRCPDRSAREPPI